MTRSVALPHSLRNSDIQLGVETCERLRKQPDTVIPSLRTPFPTPHGAAALFERGLCGVVVSPEWHLTPSANSVRAGVC